MGLAGGAQILRAEEPEPSKPLYNTFSDEEEMAMGRQAAEEAEKKYPLLREASVENYLADLGRQLAQASRRPRLEFHFRVMDTPVVNAFSLPSGYVYVHRGLFEFVETESELIGVLAHEVGHVVAYHSMNDVARRWMVDRLVYEGKKAGLLTDQQTLDVLNQYGGPILLFVDRKFSREEEDEADLLGLYNAERAGWDPNGLIAFLRRIGEQSITPGFAESLLRRHPLPAERVDVLRVELEQHPPARRLTKDTSKFKAAKARLQSLPPPPQPPSQPGANF